MQTSPARVTNTVARIGVTDADQGVPLFERAAKRAWSRATTAWPALRSCGGTNRHSGVVAID